MKIVSYNIRFGGQGRETLLVKVLHSVNPDVIILQEATSPHLVESLAHRLGMPFWGARKGYSLALLSRLPVTHYHWHNPKWSKHPFLEIKIKTIPLWLFGVHLHPYFSKRSEQKRVQEIQSVLKVISEDRANPHLLIGDFNAIAPDDDVRIEQMPAWIKLLILLNGRHIPRKTIQTLLQFGYIDGFRELHPDCDGFTLPTPTPQVRLDYVFVPSSLSKCLKECIVVKDTPFVAQASDHYPLLVTIEVSDNDFTA